MTVSSQDGPEPVPHVTASAGLASAESGVPGLAPADDDEGRG